MREALQYCVNKQHLVQVTGGPAINQPINQILPPAMTVGYKKINPYPSPNNAGNPAKCKSMLAAAGYPHGMTLTLAYANNPPMPAQAVALQSDFAKGGVTLKLNEQPTQGAYFDFLETPTNHAKWDLAFGDWFPDWTGNGAATYFSPLFDGRGYAAGSTDYGDYNDPTVNKYIDAAEDTGSLTVAATNWAEGRRLPDDQGPGLGAAARPGAAAVHRVHVSSTPSTCRSSEVSTRPTSGSSRSSDTRRCVAPRSTFVSAGVPSSRAAVGVGRLARDRALVWRPSR